MSNSQQMKKGLSVRDLITTGILAALYMVCAMIGEAIFGFFPVLTFLCPLSIALLCGPVYMLILAKVPKHGPIIVTGILVGGVLFVLGMYWSMCLAYCILGEHRKAPGAGAVCLCVRRSFLFLFHREVWQFFQQLHNQVLFHVLVNGHLVDHGGVVFDHLLFGPLLTGDSGLDMTLTEIKAFRRWSMGWQNDLSNTCRNGL